MSGGIVARPPPETKFMVPGGRALENASTETQNTNVRYMWRYHDDEDLPIIGLIRHTYSLEDDITLQQMESS
jgi:hypothetical protein